MIIEEIITEFKQPLRPRGSADSEGQGLMS